LARGQDTQWVMDRAALEAAKGAGVTEVPPGRRASGPLYPARRS
jgi:hypothetical protein